MPSAEYYRSQAARSRRLAKTAIDPELQEQLKRAAADYDAMATETERQTDGKRPPESSSGMFTFVQKPGAN